MRKFGVFLLATLVLWGCRTPEDPIFEEDPHIPIHEEQSEGSIERPMVMGDQLRNPYKESAMVDALLSLHADEILREVSVSDIPANFYYVRFLPANDEELRELESIKDGVCDNPFGGKQRRCGSAVSTKKRAK